MGNFTFILVEKYTNTSTKAYGYFIPRVGDIITFNEVCLKVERVFIEAVRNGGDSNENPVLVIPTVVCRKVYISAVRESPRLSFNEFYGKIRDKNDDGGEE